MIHLSNIISHIFPVSLECYFEIGRTLILYLKINKNWFRWIMKLENYSMFQNSNFENVMNFNAFYDMRQNVLFSYIWILMIMFFFHLIQRLIWNRNNLWSKIETRLYRFIYWSEITSLSIKIYNRMLVSSSTTWLICSLREVKMSLRQHTQQNKIWSLLKMLLFTYKNYTRVCFENNIDVWEQFGKRWWNRIFHLLSDQTSQM